MKKVVYLLSIAFFFAACSKEEVSTTPQNNGMDFSANAEGKLQIVNETFTIGKGKASAQTYILRAIASAPVVNGVPTNCTSVQVNGSFGPAGTGDIYATWHTVDPTHGGAISGYNYDLSKTDETIMSFTGELRFPSVDFHQAVLNPVADRIYYVGQRDPNDGFYDESILSSTVSTSPSATGFHSGAVAGYITLDGSGDITSTSTFSEVPLYGFGANGIAVHDGGIGGEFYEVATGDEQGRVYRLNADLTRTADSSTGNFPDGEFVAAVGNEISVFQGSTPGGAASASLYTYGKNDDINDGAPTVNIVDLSAVVGSSVEVERNAIAAYLDGVTSRVLIAYGDGLAMVTDPGNTGSLTNFIDNIGGESRGVASDEANKLVYLANGENGVFVIDGPDAATAGTVVGNYNRNLTIDAKDVFTDGNNDFLFISDANGSLYIIEKL